MRAEHPHPLEYRQVFRPQTFKVEWGVLYFTRRLNTPGGREGVMGSDLPPPLQVKACSLGHEREGADPRSKDMTLKGRASRVSELNRNGNVYIGKIKFLKQKLPSPALHNPPWSKVYKDTVSRSRRGRGSLMTRGDGYQHMRETQRNGVRRTARNCNPRGARRMEVGRRGWYFVTRGWGPGGRTVRRSWGGPYCITKKRALALGLLQEEAGGPEVGVGSDGLRSYHERLSVMVDKGGDEFKELVGGPEEEEGRGRLDSHPTPERGRRAAAREPPPGGTGGQWIRSRTPAVAQRTQPGPAQDGAMPAEGGIPLSGPAEGAAPLSLRERAVRGKEERCRAERRQEALRRQERRAAHKEVGRGRVGRPTTRLDLKDAVMPTGPGTEGVQDGLGQQEGDLCRLRNKAPLPGEMEHEPPPEEVWGVGHVNESLPAAKRGGRRVPKEEPFSGAPCLRPRGARRGRASPTPAGRAWGPGAIQRREGEGSSEEGRQRGAGRRGMGEDEVMNYSFTSERGAKPTVKRGVLRSWDQEQEGIRQMESNLRRTGLPTLRGMSIHCIFISTRVGY